MYGSKYTMRSCFNIIKPFLKEIRLHKPPLLKEDTKPPGYMERKHQKFIKIFYYWIIMVGRVVLILNFFHPIKKNRGGVNQKYVKL